MTTQTKTLNLLRAFALGMFFVAALAALNHKECGQLTACPATHD